MRVLGQALLQHSTKAPLVLDDQLLHDIVILSPRAKYRPYSGEQSMVWLAAGKGETEDLASGPFHLGGVESLGPIINSVIARFQRAARRTTLPDSGQAFLSREIGGVAFGLDASGYHQGRLAYPDALYNELFARLPASPTVLEIGAGSGLVT